MRTGNGTGTDIRQLKQMMVGRLLLVVWACCMSRSSSHVKIKLVLEILELLAVLSLLGLKVVDSSVLLVELGIVSVKAGVILIASLEGLLANLEGLLTNLEGLLQEYGIVISGE